MGPITFKASTATGPDSPKRGFPVARVIPPAAATLKSKFTPCSNTALSNLLQLYFPPFSFINCAVAEGPSKLNFSCPSLANFNISSFPLVKARASNALR